MNEKQLKKTLGRLAEELVPDNSDLWPAIRDRFETSKHPTIQGDHSMNQTLARRRLAAAFLLAFLLVVTLLFATPQGRALAQGIVNFFTHAESDRLPVQPWQQTPLPTQSGPDLSSIIDANQPVAEIEQQAGYDILEPAWLPNILSFKGASLDTEHKIARLFYEYTDTNGLVLREERFAQTGDCDLCSVVGASAAIERVMVGNSPGEYVQGVWKLTDSGPVWESDPFLQTLRWQANGMAFELLYMGPPDSISKADLIAIAESLR